MSCTTLLAVMALCFGTKGGPTPEIAFTLWDWTDPGKDMAQFEAWVDDLAGLGFTRIEISVPWNKVEPQPGEYDLSFIEERLAVCKRMGLGMRLRINSYHSGATPAWYDGDFWMDSQGQTVNVGGTMPSIHDERFWNRFGPVCTVIARRFAGEDVLYSAFIGVHAELKWADWWSFDASSLAFWRKSIARPRPDWLRAVVSEDLDLPETPPVSPHTAGTPDQTPVHRAVVAFRETSWRLAVERFTAAIRAGDPQARISSPLGESYRRYSAHMSNLDYWGLSRGANQVVHSYDFFWHANEPPWLAAASVAAFQGITGLSVSFEFDGPGLLSEHGYSPADLLAIGRQARARGAGVNISNWSYQSALPSSHALIRDIVQLWKEPQPLSEERPKNTVLLFVSKWANYCYAEDTEWLHDAQFGIYKLLNDLGVPVRFINEDNLSEDLSHYRAVYRAFSPAELLPQDLRERLDALGLPSIVDVPTVPSPTTGQELTFAEGDLGKFCVAYPGCPVAPVGCEGLTGEWAGFALTDGRQRFAAYKPGCVVLGYPLGLIYLHGPDPDMQKKLLAWALLWTAEIEVG